jgi:hypothetical protein
MESNELAFTLGREAARARLPQKRTHIEGTV